MIIVSFKNLSRGRSPETVTSVFEPLDPLDAGITLGFLFFHVRAVRAPGCFLSDPQVRVDNFETLVETNVEQWKEWCCAQPPAKEFTQDNKTNGACARAAWDGELGRRSVVLEGYVSCIVGAEAPSLVKARVKVRRWGETEIL